MVTFAGWQLEVYVKTGSAYNILLNGIQKITYDFMNDIKVMEECGSRYPTAIVEGIYATTGVIERFYTGSGMIVEFLGTGSTGNSSLAFLGLMVFPEGSGSTGAGKQYIEFNGIKLNKMATTQKPGSSLFTETWDWIGTGSMKTGTS